MSVGKRGARVCVCIGGGACHDSLSLLSSSSGLHEQRLDEEKRVKDEAAAKKTLATAEAEAETQFKEDQAAAEAARAALGAWVSVSVCVWEGGKKGGWCVFFLLTHFHLPTQEDDESGHLYNARLRYYYNKCVCGRRACVAWKDDLLKKHLLNPPLLHPPQQRQRHVLRWRPSRLDDDARHS